MAEHWKDGTRRLDVETRWLKDLGINAAKDTITLQEYNRVRNHLEDKYAEGQDLPAGRFAEMILQ